MGAIASQSTSLTIVYSIVYSDADQRKHLSSASLAFVRGIHRGPGNSPHKWPVTRKMFPFNDVIMVVIMLPRRPRNVVRSEKRALGIVPLSQNIPVSAQYMLINLHIVRPLVTPPNSVTANICCRLWWLQITPVCVEYDVECDMNTDPDIRLCNYAL